MNILIFIFTVIADIIIIITTETLGNNSINNLSLANPDMF